ncbi:hypothetical protein GSI_12272 [Ganoderma sinense ZZ0214-1]|uniref:Uncharacterized protein n=1 Tax=Ganoderma sinense ZZ0214-1 TaxID=1077348 RepID=A0A2G8RYF0_9APHY|nr:hypothetical protein GSI_12272 [Ganoderma sinense ZZ0214-1]
MEEDGGPVTPIPAYKAKAKARAQAALGVGTPELDQWIKTGQGKGNAAQGKGGKRVGFARGTRRDPADQNPRRGLVTASYSIVTSGTHHLYSPPTSATPSSRPSVAHSPVPTSTHSATWPAPFRRQATSTNCIDFTFSNHAYMITVTTAGVSRPRPGNLPPSSTTVGPFLPRSPSSPCPRPRLGWRSGGSSCMPFITNSTLGRLFETPRNAQVHMMSLSCGDHSRSCYLFVHNWCLLLHIPIPPGLGSGKSEGEEVKVIERQWDDWGLDHTHFVNWIAHFQWLRYLHGQRIIFLPILLHEGDEDREIALFMIDFNVHPKRLDDPVDMTGQEELGLGLGVKAGNVKYEMVDKEHVTDPRKHNTSVHQESSRLSIRLPSFYGDINIMRGPSVAPSPWFVSNTSLGLCSNLKWL